MAIVVVLPHWRLQQRIRYLASVLRTSDCFGLGCASVNSNWPTLML